MSRTHFPHTLSVNSVFSVAKSFYANDFSIVAVNPQFLATHHQTPLNFTLNPQLSTLNFFATFLLKLCHDLC